MQRDVESIKNLRNFLKKSETIYGLKKNIEETQQQ
jgi:hypothetical protein